MLETNFTWSKLASNISAGNAGSFIMVAIDRCTQSTHTQRSTPSRPWTPPEDPAPTNHEERNRCEECRGMANQMSQWSSRYRGWNSFNKLSRKSGVGRPSKIQRQIRSGSHKKPRDRPGGVTASTWRRVKQFASKLNILISASLSRRKMASEVKNLICVRDLTMEDHRHDTHRNGGQEAYYIHTLNEFSESVQQTGLTQGTVEKS